MKISALLSIILCFLLTTDANAQHKKHYTNFNDSLFNIEEVTVSAKHKKKPEIFKLDVPVKFVPVSTNQLDAKILENRGIRNIEEATRFLPGVHFRTTYGAFQQVSIRGFDNSIVLVDGVRDERSSIDNSYPFMDLSSVESIELLKGPASVLYGQSAVGGVLNMVRKAPVSKQNVYARIAYGSYNNQQATFAMGGKMIGPLNYRANVNYQAQDGWRDNNIKRLSGYFTLGGKLTAKDELDIRIGANRDFYPTEIGLPDVMTADIFKASDNSKYLNKGDMLPELNKKARYNSESDFMYNRSYNASAQYKHTFNETFKLTDKLSYSYDDIDYFGTEDLAYLTSEEPIYDHYYMSGSKKTYICLDSIYYKSPLRFSHIAKTVNNQLELSGKFQTGDVKHNYLGGYSFITLLRDSYSGYDLKKNVTGPGLTTHGYVYNPHSLGWMDTNFGKVSVQRSFMHGFYLQDLIEFSDELKMMLAGRYDLYTYKSASTTTIDGKRKYDTPEKDAFNKIKNQSFTFRAGLVYLPIEQVSVYGSFGTYFKPIRTFYQDNTIYIDKNGNEYNPSNGGEVFKPESGYQAEVGARYDLSNKLQVNASIFYINKKNIKQKLASKGEVIGGITLDKDVQGQVGKMDSKGFDIDITYSPIAGLSMTAGYGYTDAKVRDMAKNSYTETNAYEGKEYQYIPQNTFYAYGDYTVTKGLLKGFGANISVSYQDKLYRNNDNSLYFNSYWTTDLGVSYILKNNVRLGANINNLFNKEYYNQAIGNQLVPSMPRNFLLSVSYTL
ncbi:TonB-dependent receptor [Bacteroides sp.]